MIDVAMGSSDSNNIDNLCALFPSAKRAKIVALTDSPTALKKYLAEANALTLSEVDENMLLFLFDRPAIRRLADSKAA
ncbi:MAG: hypothetical protein GKR98_04680 [Boseongicola sp.]|nr:MAG: hypothetical protein GKR98_04680 [Boseongicola sp.]